MRTLGYLTVASWICLAALSVACNGGLSDDDDAGKAQPTPHEDEYVPGEVVFKFKDGVSEQEADDLLTS